MPDPTAHADDMKSPAQPNTMPSFWWINPWSEAIAWHRRAENAYLSGVESAKKYVKLSGEKLEADAFAMLHKTERYDFLRRVEVTLEKAGGPKGYADTIDLVHWAADEIVRLRVQLVGMTEDRDAYIEKLEKANAGRTLLVSRDNQIDGLFADIEREKQKVEAITLMCNERDRAVSALEIDVESLSRQLRAAKRKLSKAEKAAGITKPVKKGGRRA